MMKNREIEVAKCIGIILVVAGHAFGAGLFAAKLYHMPLFFFISGLTLGVNDEFSLFMKKRVKRLYIPFVIYEIVYLLLSLLFYDIGLLAERYSNWREVFYALLHVVLFDNCSILLAPIWFVTALFFASILAYCIYRLAAAMNMPLTKYYLYIESLVLIYIGLILGRLNWLQIPMSYNFKKIISVVIMACGYILLGVAVRRSDKIHRLVYCSGNKSLVLILCLGLMILFERSTLIKADMRSNTYDYLFLQPLFAFIGISGVFAIARVIVRLIENVGCIFCKKVVMYISSHTFSLMCLHPIAFKIIGIIQVYMLGFDKERLSGWQLVDEAIYWKCLVFLAGMLVPLLCDVIYEMIWSKIKDESK